RYQGAFLDGVFISDVSPDFEQWVDLTRARLAARAAAAAGEMALAAHGARDYAAEVVWATQAIRLAPDDEPRLRTLMTALAASGDRAGALRAFRTFAERLDEDYDAEPDAATTALADAMRAGGAPPETAAPPTTELPVVAVGAIERALAPVSAPQHRRRWTVLGVGAAIIALAAVIGAYFFGQAPPRVAGILVADFRNHTRDSLLAGAVTEALRADLSQSRRTRVMSRAEVQAVLDRMRQPTGDIGSDIIVREVAERHGVTAFVTGDVASLGSGYSVSAELIAVKDGEVLVSVRENARDSTGLLGALDKVSEQLRRGIGESRWSVRATPPLEEVSTASLQALRLYSQAIRVGDQEGDNRRAVEILRQAVALDTTFAMAYRKLGTYLRDMGMRAGADDALAHAFRYRGRLPELERFHTAGSYFLNAAIPDSAIATYRALLAVYPNDMRALNNLGDVYMDLREYARAESLFHRSIEADSTVALLFNHLATDQFNGGRYDEAERTLKARARRFPPQQDAEGIETSLEMMRGDIDGARSRSAQMLVDAGSDVDARAEPLKMLGILSIIRGRLGEADQIYVSLAEGQANARNGGGYLEAAIARAFIDVRYRQQPARGLALLDSAVARFPLDSLAPLDRNYAPLAYLYALGGRPSRARELLANVREFERAPGATRGGLGLRDEGTYLRALGATELAEGKRADAVTTLQRSVQLYYCPTCTLPDLALAYELTGIPDSAIAVYQRYVTTPWSEWQNSLGDSRVTAYQRLAALHEARGDTAAAIAAYDEVATLWAHADVELQPLVADAQRRSSALGVRRATAMRIPAP
ncbi:MAG: BTAD domain-containing putative transcriptional regulator, partial [Gemmatimonadales bacterium]